MEYTSRVERISEKESREKSSDFLMDSSFKTRFLWLIRNKFGNKAEASCSSKFPANPLELKTKQKTANTEPTSTCTNKFTNKMKAFNDADWLCNFLAFLGIIVSILLISIGSIGIVVVNLDKGRLQTSNGYDGIEPTVPARFSETLTEVTLNGSVSGVGSDKKLHVPGRKNRPKVVTLLPFRPSENEAAIGEENEEKILIQMKPNQINPKIKNPKTPKQGKELFKDSDSKTNQTIILLPYPNDQNPDNQNKNENLFVDIEPGQPDVPFGENPFKFAIKSSPSSPIKGNLSDYVTGSEMSGGSVSTTEIVPVSTMPTELISKVTLASKTSTNSSSIESPSGSQDGPSNTNIRNSTLESASKISSNGTDTEMIKEIKNEVLKTNSTQTKTLDTSSLENLIKLNTDTSKSLAPMTIQYVPNPKKDNISGCILNEQTFSTADDATRIAWAEQCKNVDVGCQFNGNNCKCGEGVCGGI